MERLAKAGRRLRRPDLTFATAEILPADTARDIRRRLHDRPGATMTLDLPAQTVTAPDGAQPGFEIDPFGKQMLLSGQDEIALTLGNEHRITEFEQRHRREIPWLPTGRA